MTIFHLIKYGENDFIISDHENGFPVEIRMDMKSWFDKIGIDLIGSDLYALEKRKEFKRLLLEYEGNFL